MKKWLTEPAGHFGAGAGRAVNCRKREGGQR